MSNPTEDTPTAQGGLAHDIRFTAKSNQVVAPSEFMVALTRLQNDLAGFIKYCEATKPSEWYLHKVRNSSNTKNCLYGHLVNWYYGKDWTGDVTAIWDAFEEVGSSFYVYPINDGQNPKYPQKTARERCIAYLKNVLNGDELWTWEAMEKEMAAYGHQDQVSDLASNNPEASAELSNPPKGDSYERRNI